MKTPSRLVIFSAAAFSLVGVASAATGAKGNNGPALANVRAPSSAPVLEAGMTTGEIERLVGQPSEIKTIETPQGNGETWIYRRQIGKQMNQEFMPGGPAVAFNDTAAAAGTPAPIERRTKITTSYQITSLLIVEGKLITAKQSRAEVVSFER